jgi:hypothetical protein
LNPVVFLVLESPVTSDCPKGETFRATLKGETFNAPAAAPRNVCSRKLTYDF